MAYLDSACKDLCQLHSCSYWMLTNPEQHSCTQSFAPYIHSLDYAIVKNRLVKLWGTCFKVHVAYRTYVGVSTELIINNIERISNIEQFTNFCFSMTTCMNKDQICTFVMAKEEFIWYALCYLCSLNLHFKYNWEFNMPHMFYFGSIHFFKQYHLPSGKPSN